MPASACRPYGLAVVGRPLCRDLGRSQSPVCRRPWPQPATPLQEAWPWLAAHPPPQREHHMRNWRGAQVCDCPATDDVDLRCCSTKAPVEEALPPPGCREDYREEELPTALRGVPFVITTGCDIESVLSKSSLGYSSLKQVKGNGEESKEGIEAEGVELSWRGGVGRDDKAMIRKEVSLRAEAKRVRKASKPKGQSFIGEGGAGGDEAMMIKEVSLASLFTRNNI
ncbi:hypothetical protein B296_00052600 [Ensete ventricosum]|uniref:Uncharacterized protein n=1 Tax=Ensete ventricosum TaxID=4639 RepID=A0A426XYV4_ENSVE|nr:hypothetical protein B296_00052600 [Ensete ventricosum]